MNTIIFKKPAETPAILANATKKGISKNIITVYGVKYSKE